MSDNSKKTRPEKGQILRHIFIDRKIRQGMRTGRYANCSSMAAEYEVSPKSIMRDIDFLKNQCDAPIAYDRSKRGYYYTEANYRLPAVNISASDLFAISIAEKVLQQHRDTPVYDKLNSVFKRIEESLPETVSIKPSWIDRRISIVEHHKTSISSDIWEAVADALQRSQTIKIDYHKPGGEARTRLVDPYHLVNYKGEWYLTGLCHLREKVLTFAVSRMGKASVTSKGFVYPADFDFDRFAASRFGIFSGEKEYRVRLEFAPRHTPYVLEREWHPSQSIHLQPDGGVVLELVSSHLFELRQWVMSWGGGVEVLEPIELRNDVINELRSALAGYEASQGRCRRVTRKKP